VDDEPDMVALLRFRLCQQGYEVVAAETGLAALNLARRFLPDLIILDLRMEGLDGFAVCDLLRHLPSTAGIPIVILTALSGDTVSQRVHLAGAADLIQKPFSPQRLVDRIEAALGAHRERELTTAEDRLPEGPQGPVFGWRDAPVQR
jgi:DNA-binding response OmpR family regulator